MKFLVIKILYEKTPNSENLTVTLRVVATVKTELEFLLILQWENKYLKKIFNLFL